MHDTSELHFGISDIPSVLFIRIDYFHVVSSVLSVPCILAQGNILKRLWEKMKRGIFRKLKSE